MNKNLQKNSRTWVFLGAILALVMYFFAIRQILSFANASQIEMIMLGGLTLVFLGAFLSFLVKLIALIFSKNRIQYSTRLRGQMVFILSILIFLAIIITASQWMAHTPPILGRDGKPSPNSIASLEKVRLGGVDQWLIIRGQDVNKPVLLFLSGGPGASEAARVLRFNQELEKHFVVVIWEQRGCGKSYPSHTPKSALT
ncbi:MAG: hypothetical protein FP831_16685, partial [Anaerolineae bacterium]|nr:hypothetical protein [Anaerolineae bacterium]